MEDVAHVAREAAGLIKQAPFVVGTEQLRGARAADGRCEEGSRSFLIRCIAEPWRACLFTMRGSFTVADIVMMGAIAFC